MDLKIMSQFGRPKFVGARRPVMVSCSALASLIMMLVASSALILAVRYWKNVSKEICRGDYRALTVWISMWSSISCASIASSSDLNHSKDPKSLQIQKK